MEAGTLAAEHKRTLGERFGDLLRRLNNAPYIVKAGAGVFFLDLALVLADRWPDSFGEWILLAVILAATIAALAPIEDRPATIAVVVLANIVAILVLYHGIHEVSQRGINGLSLGAIYALGAVGLTLVYGILKLVNFAHGDFLTFGAYMAYLVNVTWELPLVFGIAFAIVTTALLGVLLEKVMWGPMRGRGAGMLQLLLMAIGLAFVIRYGIQFIWGTELRQLDVNRTATVNFLDLRIGRTQLIVIVVGFATLIATGLMLRVTLLGKRMRALSDDLDLAETSGIDTSRVILYTWMFAAGSRGSRRSLRRRAHPAPARARLRAPAADLRRGRPRRDRQCVRRAGRGDRARGGDRVVDLLRRPRAQARGRLPDLDHRPDHPAAGHLRPGEGGVSR